MNARRPGRARTVVTVGFAIGILIAVAACRTVGQPGSHQPPLASDSLGSGVLGSSRDNALEIDRDGGRSSKAAPAESVSSPPPRWSKVPESAGELFGAVDGRCNHLGVSMLENEVLVHYGRDVWDGKFSPTLARATDDAVVVDAAMNAGLDAPNTTININYLTGHWPDAAYLVFDNGGRCAFAVRALRFAEGKWKPAFALPDDHGIGSVSRYGGGAIGLRNCPGCGGESACVGDIFIGDNAKAPPITGDGFAPSSYRTLPTGEIFAVGTVCKGDQGECAGQLRWWSPGAKVGYTPVAGKAQRGEGVILVKSKTEVYVAQGTYFGMFDGAKLTKLSTPTAAPTSALHDAKAGGIWVESDGKVWQRKSDGAYDDVTPPQFAGKLVGVAEGAPWSIVKGNQIYKRTSGAWQKVDLPRPPFSSTAAFLTVESVKVRAPDDVFVIASYAEMQPGWNEVEKRLTLLRTKRPKETIRCEASGRGFESWPAPATEGCTTPFVVLAPVSATSPKDFDYPKTRSTLRPKASLVVGGELAEIRENGKVWIGVVPSSLANGRTLAQLYSVTFPMTHSEVVCAEPTIARRIAIDPGAKK